VFQPVSKIPYHVLDENQQILVCCLDDVLGRETVEARWKRRAVAWFPFKVGDDLCDVVRDLLANPQIRAIVFIGESDAEKAFQAFWGRTVQPGWKIREEHLELVRQFVDLFNGDCGFHSAQQPFWPTRLKYEEET